MWFLFLQIWWWLLLAFVAGWFAHWFFCCRGKETPPDAAVNSDSTAKQKDKSEAQKPDAQPTPDDAQ